MKGKVENKCKGIFIPIEILSNKDLSIMEKLFLTRIIAFEKGTVCFASNNWFGELFQVSGGRSSQIIKSLIKKEYIKRELFYKGKLVVKRVLKPTNKTPKEVLNKIKRGYLENEGGVVSKLKGGTENIKEGTENIKGGYLENDVGNNRVINNRNNNRNINNTTKVSQQEADAPKKEKIIILEVKEKPELEIEKKVTEKKSSAKRKVNNGWTAKWLDIFSACYKIAESTNDDYISETKDFRDFGRIKKKLEMLFKKRNPGETPTDEIMSEWFEHFANKAMKIKWIKENYRPTNLASQFSKIVAYKSEDKSNTLTIIQELKAKHELRARYNQNQ